MNRTHSNKTQDVTEAGIVGLTVSIYYDLNANGTIDAADTLIASTTSGANGAYGFAQLLPDTYIVKVTDPTSILNGGTVTTTGGAQQTASVTLLGQAITGKDFGYTVVNVAPVNTVPGAQTVNEDLALAFSGGKTISVADKNNNVATTKLTVTNGMLNVSLAGGATISSGALGSATLTLSGTQAQINAALASLTYQGKSNFAGSDTLSVVSTDNAGTPLSDTDTVAITVSAINDAPVGVNDAGAATEAGGVANGTAGTNATGTVLTNDTDVDNTAAQLSVSAIRTGTEAGSGSAGTVGSALAGTYGTLTLNAAGSYTYVINQTNATVQALNTGASLTDTFTYTVKDTAGLTDTAQLVITVNGANDAPVATNDTGAATEAGGTANGTAGTNATGTVLTNDTDIDNTTASLTVSAVRTGTEAGSGTAGTVGTALAGTYGTLTLNTDGTYSYVVNNTNATVQALNPGGTLTDTFTYTTRDPAGLTDLAQLVITVNGANDAPVATNDTGAATEAGGTANGTAGTNATGTVLTNDTDIDNTTASLTVSAVRTGTEAGSGTAGTVGTALAGTYGTLTLNADGTYSYVVNNANATVQALNTGGTLTDTFTYTARDPAGLTDLAQLVITVNGANDAPVATNDTGSATEAGGTANGTAGTNATGTVLTNDTDIDNTTASLTVSAVRTGTEAGSGTAGTVGTALAGTYGTLTLNADGTYSYVVNNANATVQALNTGGTLTDTFTYTARDPAGLTDTAQLVITVNGANDAPVNAVPTARTVAEDTLLAIGGVSVADVDSAILTTTLTVSNGTLSVGTSGGGSVTGNGLGTLSITGTAAQINAALAGLTYLGSQDFSGPDLLTVATSDGTAEQVVSYMGINVTSVDDIFTDTPEVRTTLQGVPLSGSVLVGASSVDGPVVVTGFTVDGTSYNAGQSATIAGVGALTVGSDGGYVFTPVATFNGPVPVVSYSLSDGLGAPVVSTLTIDVTPAERFSDVTDGVLTFTGSNDPIANIYVSETDTGDTIPFVAFKRQPIAVDGPATGMQWSAFAATVFGPSGSMELNFVYDVVSNTPGQLITSFDTLYVVDVATLGTGMTAVQTVYDTQGNLIGTQTYVFGGPAPAPVQFVQGHMSVSVRLTIIETVESESPDSMIDMSLIQQTFGTTSTTQLCTIGDYVWLDQNGNGLQDDGAGASGVGVHLTNASGTHVLASTTTDSTGHYLFEHVQAGTYALTNPLIFYYDITVTGQV